MRTNLGAAFAGQLSLYISRGDKVLHHDETNYNTYLSRTNDRSRIGAPAAVGLPTSKSKNARVICGTSPGVVLIRTQKGSVNMTANAGFVADLFLAALETPQYAEVLSSNHDCKVAIVTDNTPAHSCVEVPARDVLVAVGMLNGIRLVVRRLAPYSPMLNPVEGCRSMIKSRMKARPTERKRDPHVHGEYQTFCHTQAFNSL